MEEKYRNHVSGLYLLCPTIPPRVLSNEQWWEVIKELSGLSHTVPMLEEDFRNSSIIQLEYLITQFIQSNPPALALRWLMNLYSLTNSYVKLSVGRLLEETMLILYRFTGTELQDMDLTKLKHHNIRIEQQQSGQTQLDNDNESITKLDGGNILDITSSQAREIQPSHVINSLYIVQTLLRLEILETRKHFPGLIRCLPQLLIHVDTSMRDAANECLLSVLSLGVPGYSLSDQLLNTLIPGVRILLEFDDSFNLERTMQSITVILIQQPKLANTRKQEVLQLIVNISSSLSSSQNFTLKTSGLIESISCLLANSTISQFSSSKKDSELYDSISYISGLTNIQFSSYGLGSYPIQGECFRIILCSSILKIIDSHTLQKTPTISQLERVWSLILEHLQTHFIRKHITENLQWLTNNHWVFLWTQILKKVLVIALSYIQDSSYIQNNALEHIGKVVWTKFEQFLNPIAKISSRISLECILELVSYSESTNWIWKLNKEFFELFLRWIFQISLTENFEIPLTSYLSGYVSAILISQYYFPRNNHHNDLLLVENIESILLSSISFTKEKIPISQSETNDTEFHEALLHNSHFLIGLSNSCSNPLITIGILNHIIHYLVESPEIQIFSDPTNSNEKLFIFNNIFLLIQNLLTNILYLNKYKNNDIDSMATTFVSKLYLLVPIWKSILSNYTIEKIVVVIESLTESCERLQLLLESNESETWTIFDDEKENPVILLFKDLKRWLALLWTTIESFHLYIELLEMLNQNEKSHTENTKLEKFLMKACFSIIECLLPFIPLSWTKFFPETNNVSSASEINPELGSILCSPSSSLEDVGEYLRNSSFSKDTINPPSGTKSNDHMKVFLQNIDKFIFPYIGDQNCFSKSVHISALIMSLKLSVYKQLNKSLFSYINHPPISNRSLAMLISDVASDQILMLDLKVPSEVFPSTNLSNINEIKKYNNISIALFSNNDILSLPEHNSYITTQNDYNITSRLGLMESMLPYSEFTSLINQKMVTSNQQLEVHFRKETALLLSNIISESHFLDQNNLFSHETIKTIFRILLKRSIHVAKFWSSVPSESQYYQQENSNVKIQNLFPFYNDLSPSLFMIAQKGLVSSPNNVSILPLLSILWLFKDISEKITTKLNMFVSNNSSQIDQEHLRLINNSQDFLFHIFSFLIKFLFGYRYRDLKQQINYQSQNNGKKLPPRIKSCIIRYYTLNLLAYLLSYLHNNKSIFSHYYYAKQKLEYLISWSNYSLSRTNRSSEDSDSLTDLYFLFSILKLKIKNMDQDLSHIIEVFFKDHFNGNISEKNKFFIYRVRKDINFQNSFIEVESDKHFGFEIVSSRYQLTPKSISILNYFGEYLCFYSLRELMNIEIFNHLTELVHNNFMIFLKYPKSLENLKQPKTNNYTNFNVLMCVSLSLIFHSRLHEISFIDYYGTLYIPNTCKIFFYQDGFLSSLWKFIKNIYFSSDILSETHSLEVLAQEPLKRMPYLNLLGLLIINSSFILRQTKVLEELSTQDYVLILNQDEKLIIMLIEWILKNYLIHNKISLSFLKSALKAMKPWKINSILIKAIKYLSKEPENTDFNQSNSINEISKFLLDENNSFNLSTFILYIQLKPFIFIKRDSSGEEFDSNEDQLRSILGVRFIINLDIIEKICETIQARIIQVSTFDSLLTQEMIAYSFWNFNKENLGIEASDLYLLGEVTKFIFKILSLILGYFETYIANLTYIESCILNRILSILKSVISLIPVSSQRISISKFSITLNKMMVMLLNFGSKNPENNIIINILEFFIQIYSSLSNEFKEKIWNTILENTNKQLDKSSSELSHSHIYLLYKLTETAGFENQCLSQKNEQDLILICGKTLDIMINSQDIELCLIRYFAYIGFFMINSIENIHHKIKNDEIREVFNFENLQILIQNIIKKNQTPTFTEKIHYIPSLVSIWNSINYSTDFTEIIVELLVYFYSSRSNKSSLQNIIFFLETVSSLRWFLLDKKVSFSSLRQDLHLDFETLSIRYFENEISKLEKEGVNDDIVVSNKPPNFTTFVGMIYIFFLDFFRVEKDFNLEEDTILEGTCNQLVYLRVYQLIHELIVLKSFGDDQIQLEMVIKSNQNLLLIHKGISLKSFGSDSNAKERIAKESYELIMNNMRFLVGKKQFSVLIYTHINWIEDEIRSSIINFGLECLEIDYYLNLIDMLCEILIEIQGLRKEIQIENEDDKTMIEKVTKIIFRIFKYQLYSQIYSHPSYFELFKNFTRDHKICENEDQIQIPDFSIILRHHKKLEIMSLNKLEELLEKSSEYNHQVFDLLVLSLLPYNYTYNLEYGNARNLVNTRLFKSWDILRNLVLNETRKKAEFSLEIGKSSLIIKIKRFLNKYLEILKKLNQDDFSIVLPSSSIVTWFQASFEQEGREIIEQVENCLSDNELKQVEYEFSKWINMGDFYLPTGNQEISIELLSKLLIYQKDETKQGNSGKKEWRNICVTSIKELKKEIEEILESIN
ncbi:Armadillo-like helical-containing protein [Cryptosporidium tyzzeri]|nr:Armadillo-like helical-containing protein [Cryptosporidium tyzzeri]